MRHRLAVLLCVLALPLGAAAASTPVNLGEAVDRALAHNPGLAAQTHAAQAATWSLRRARAQLLPSVSLESRYTRLDDETVYRANALGHGIWLPMPSAVDSSSVDWQFIEIPQSVFRDGYETSISGQMLLLDPSVWNGVSLASTSRKLAESDLEAARQETIYRTLRSFVELLKIDSMIHIQTELLDRARENRAQAGRLFQVGRYAEADVLRWQVEEVRQQQALVELQSGRQVAALALENVMGDPPVGTTQPDTLLPPALVREIRHFRQMDATGWEAFSAQPLEEVIAANPRLVTLDQSVRTAELQHRQSSIAFLPRVALTASYGWQANDTFALDGEKAWSMSAVLSMPLFTSSANLSARQATKHRLQQARGNMDAGRREILLSAESARTSIRSHAELLRLAELSLTSARRNYEIRKNSFALGRLSNLDWIDALLALRSAEQGRTTAYYDLVLAVADYYQARGRIAALTEEN